MATAKPAGLTKDTGFVMGIRRTFPVGTAEAWDFLFSDAGFKIWLGSVAASKLALNEPLKLRNGTEIEFKVLKENSHMRLRWKKKEWKNLSTLQVRVLAAKTGTTISFHQENLLNASQRSEMLLHWENVLDKLEKHLKAKA
jgi:activator of HSP90 ATPase